MITSEDQEDIEQAYRLLDVPIGASTERIREAYLILAKVWHPDRFGADLSLQRVAQEKTKSLNAAYATIKTAPLQPRPAVSVDDSPGHSAAVGAGPGPHVSTTPGIAAAATKISVWLPWYFGRGALTLITAPLCLLLIYCVAVATVGAVVQLYMLLQVTSAVYGVVATVVMLSGGLIPVIVPPAAYFSLLRNLPGLWLRADASRGRKFWSSIAMLVLLPGIAYVTLHAVFWVIFWIADRNPCASFAAGITGSRPPVGCP